MGNVAYQSIPQRELPQEQPAQNPKKNSRKRYRVTKGETTLFILFCIVVFFSSIHLVELRAQNYLVNRDIQELEAKIAEKELNVNETQNHVEELSAPDRIIQKAK